MVDVSNGKNPFGNVLERMKGGDARKGSEADARRPRERVLSPTDGRVLRSKGKTVPVNYRVTPEFKQDVFDLAKEDAITMTEVLERAVALYKRTPKGKRV